MLFRTQVQLLWENTQIISERNATIHFTQKEISFGLLSRGLSEHFYIPNVPSSTSSACRTHQCPLQPRLESELEEIERQKEEDLFRKYQGLLHSNTNLPPCKLTVGNAQTRYLIPTSHIYVIETKYSFIFIKKINVGVLETDTSN